MHIIVAFLGLVGGGLFWWYRLRAIGRGRARRLSIMPGVLAAISAARKSASKRSMSPLTAIEDPALAAATVIYAIISEDNLPGDSQIRSGAVV